MHAKHKLSWLRRTTMSREHNLTTVLLNMWCECMSRYNILGCGHCTRTAADRMCTVTQYYDISSKADHGGILIVHDLKLWYRSSLCCEDDIKDPESLYSLWRSGSWPTLEVCMCFQQHLLERQANVQSYTITYKSSSWFLGQLFLNLTSSRGALSAQFKHMDTK